MENVVWESRLDDRYDCRVVRMEPYMGELTIFEGATELLREDVSLAYDALFGPDIDDVATWQARCIEVIDGGGAP